MKSIKTRILLPILLITLIGMTTISVMSYFEISAALDNQMTISIKQFGRSLIIRNIITILAMYVTTSFIVFKITSPLKNIVNLMKEIRKGNLEVQLENNSKDEIGVITNEINELTKFIKKDIVGTMNLISQGNLDINIETLGENDEITPSMITLIETLNGLTDDINILKKAFIEGKLKVRGNSIKYLGGYKDIVNNINKVLDILVGYIDIVPVSLTIIDNDNNIQYMNRDAMKMSSIKDNLTSAKCYDCFKTTVCNTDKCVSNIAKKNDKKLGSETILQVHDKKLDVYLGAAPIKDEEGKIIGSIEVYMDQTKVKTAQRISDKRSAYLNKEIEKLIDNLRKLAKGDLNIKAEISETDEDTEFLGENFNEINLNLENSVNSFKMYISEIDRVLTDIVNGNFDIKIDIDFIGDFETIKEALNEIIASLNRAFLRINDTADQVASGAAQVSDGSQELSQGATEQASSIEELTASITQIALQTKQNAVNADDANYLAEEAKTDAAQGNVQMQLMLESMEEINESSNNIYKIIKVIDEIAFQTNILALNAAVEAARAGQHGKGFAVVAEEVRNLAERSANAAKETTELIEGSVSKVKAGTDIANTTAEALEKIVEGVSKAADLVGQIAVASNEQATGITQINQGVNQVDKVTQTNSATSQESAATSEELSRQAKSLKDMVNQFTFSKDFLEENKIKALPEKIKVDEVAITSSNQEISFSDDEYGKY